MRSRASGVARSRHKESATHYARGSVPTYPHCYENVTVLEFSCLIKCGSVFRRGLGADGTAGHGFVSWEYTL